MGRDDTYIVIPCDCGTLDHCVIFVASKFMDNDLHLLIRFPIYHEAGNALQRFKNIMKRRFKFTFNVVLDSRYFSLFRYLWLISFPNRIFEYSAMEYHNQWKIYLSESEITLGYLPSISQIIEYLIYGVIERPLEIFIDKEGPIPNDYVQLF